ncbi:MAG: AAA family ATPase [Kiritimatiellae bacterium]|nr:AAA family ATPase [Kiritimatiellia bacterium]
MEKVATDIFTFSELRKNGFTYVDKTDILYALASGDVGKQFFIARPRRFGKSLAISTLESLFQGERELFQGLAIEPKWDWSKKWPVLHLDMGSAQTTTVAELHLKWRDMLKDECQRNGIAFRDDENPATAFKNVINDLAATSEDGLMVVLIDEYDKPILNHLLKSDVAEFRDALKMFYSVVKTWERKQRFTFLTGVSKFSKVSIFSDLNNLNDWTMHAKAATLFGYTHEEVLKYFPGRIHELAEAQGLSDEEAFAKIIEWYDGYRFEENAKPVINPVSLGLCFANGKFANYWSQTAMPTFLVDILKQHPINFLRVNVPESALGAYEPADPNGTTLLYQTGYLTITACRDFGGTRSFTLDFPNREIRESFLRDVMQVYSGIRPDETGSAQIAAAAALYDHDVPGFLRALRTFFRNIPYDLTDRQNEQMWQAICYVVLRLIGVSADGEVKTGDGRIDLVCNVPGEIYIIEFKLDKPATEAMAQIKGKDYAGKYALSGKRITLIGISFSSEKRTIVEELVEEIPS